MTVTYAILGAGQRGAIYASWIAAHPDRARVVALADPDARARHRVAEAAAVGDDGLFASWQELLAARPAADTVIVATQDADHIGPAIAALEAGYHVLLEKPMAPTPDDCRSIAAAVAASDRLFAVCHVMRYTPYTQRLTELLRDGAVGDIVSIQHLEPVGWWHFAHSFVRGNWRNEAASSPLLLAKSCHDLDWMAHVVGSPIARVSSFGSLRHFRPENAPEGATDRCVTCPHVSTCPHSAVDHYVDRPVTAPDEWPVTVVAPTSEELGEALASGPYGRCVYACDNDVVDHQVVSCEFANWVTGSFTVTAFTPKQDRQTRIFGSHGYLEGDGREIRVLDFATRTETTFPTSIDTTVAAGHGGGDAGLMDAWTAAVAAGDPRRASSDVEASLASHLAVFAAEEARRTGRVVDVDQVTVW